MALLAYLPHVIYSTALTSLAIHHLAQRKALEADRAHVAAQLSILEDLRTRLVHAAHAQAAGSPRTEDPDLDPREIERLWRLAKSHDVWRARAEVAAHEEAARAAVASGDSAAQGEGIGWKEVLFGKRFDTKRSEELDRRDLERVRKEVEEAN
ncbi:hypothetical protein C8Q70DRAFT_1055528 [Cubamyces menziesii]|uniref:Uncharacterized protein n=1 Tax=Trametes cubensis TaxID=1111947 RepID=A0AAD7XDW7_9APHY|nr:hypothetical protein C8Q70DRAFT_1055528 [Cubamyces menziesii]KAJ8490143.1 hypothetical protein ONZ51_g2488 [Trametes cubensis]